MKITHQVNTKISEFVETRPKKAMLVSIILKVVAFSILAFKDLSITFFYLSSLSFFVLSCFIDLKVYDKIDNLLFFIFPKTKEEDPYKTGIHIGIVIGSFFKNHFFQRVEGIFSGLKKIL